MLNRFTFGPRPGEVEAVMRQGPYAWFAQQLQPASIPDTALEQRLAKAYPSLNLPPDELLEEFPSTQIVRQIAIGKLPWPQDPVQTAVDEVLVTKFNQRRAPQAGGDAAELTPEQKRERRTQQQAAARALANQVLAYPANQRMRAILQLPVNQRITLTQFVPNPQRGMLLAGFTPAEREIFYEMAGGPNAIHVIDSEFEQAKVLRAILSRRQLLEVMTDFWYNHFNVDIRKGADQWYAPAYERDAIRPYALGKFSDLLLATAQNPAMLFYLDNWTSVGPDSPAARHEKKKKLGINENYGREVMELHTVGVDSGYTQADVIALAKIMTGWTIDRPQYGGPFVYRARRHEPGTIHWFGNTVHDDGYAEGYQALEWLAAQPQTAHHVCFELAQRFVADNPPPDLVNRMVKTWMASDGDIADVLRTMVHSPEFNSQRYYRVKVKTPLEFVASVFRATNTNPTNPGALVNEIAHMGEPLYQMEPPTGYPTASAQWMNAGALVERLNFSIKFADSKFGGIKFDAPVLLATGLLDAPPASRGGGQAQPVSLTTSGNTDGQALALMENLLLDGQVSQRTTAAIQKELASQQALDPSQKLDDMTAMLLGSPEFQMH